jgi:hypothetical protein
MMRVAGLGMLALVLLPAVGVSAPSSSRRHLAVSLHYQRRPGASSCPSETELRRQVKAILGYSPFVKNARTSLTCVLWGEAEAQHARVQLRDRRTRKLVGQRELSTSGRGCEELGSAVALAIALAVDPLAKPPPRPDAVAAAPFPHSTAPAPPSNGTSPRAVPPTGASRAPGGKGTAGSVALAAPPLSAGVAARAEPLPAIPDGGVAQRPAAAPDAGAAQALAVVPDAGAPLVVAAVPDAGAGQVIAPAPDAGVAAALALATLLGVPDAGSEVSPAQAVAPDAGASDPAASATTGPPDAGAPELGAAPAPEDALAASGGDTPRRSWNIFAGVDGDLTVGVVPSTAPGVALYVGVAWSSASVELEGRWLPTSSLSFQGGTISTSLVSAGLSGCALFGPWGACGVAQAGPFSSSGSGYGQAKEASTWVVSLGARAQWIWVFANPVGLRLHVDGLVNLIRPRLLVNASEAWEAPPVALVVGAGLYARF